MRSRILRGVSSVGVVAALGVAAAGASRPLQPEASRAIPAVPPRFEVLLPATARTVPLTGRLVVIVSKPATGGAAAGTTPRMLSPSFAGPALYAIDLEQLRPGQTATVDQSAIGYPKPLAELPPGDYDVQARVNAYTQVKRADGHTIWVHVNDGTVSQSQFGSAEGDLYSAPQRVRIGDGGTIRLSLDSVIGPPRYPADTKWYKHLRFQSPSLTKFWGRPVYIHARVLLPKGYDEHPTTRYPVVYTLGHTWTPLSFAEPQADQRPGGRGGATPGDSINPATGFDRDPMKMYAAWTSEDYPRFIAVTLQQATPWFPDSYSINSANQGPYGDAVVKEIIPHLEQQFRMIGKPYARHLEGASTSGWQTLALMLRNPDFFGGAWVLQPDPIDFERYQLVNIYADTNAFAIPKAPLTTADRYFMRNVDGQPVITVREMSLWEEVLGTKGRAGGQLSAWEALYGPVGPDGYPRPLWNKLTGTIDRDVASYMRDNGYDLLAYTRKNWGTLGPKLQGKLRFFAGDMDQYYLNLAVYSWEDFLSKTTNPRSDATFTYGRPMKGHSWHAWTWRQFGREAAAVIAATAPPGENTAAWHYP
jgi:hypothetical protein